MGWQTPLKGQSRLEGPAPRGVWLRRADQMNNVQGSAPGC